MVRKYQNRNAVDIILGVIFYAVLWYVLPERYTFIAIVIALACTPYLIAEGRLAFIFTPDEVIYRPIFGSPRHFKFEYIVEIRKVTVRRFVAGNFAGFDPGVALRILGGETFYCSLRVSDRDDVLQQLSTMTGKSIH